MDQQHSVPSRIYKPRPSMGWLSLLALGAILALIGYLVIAKMGLHSVTAMVILAVIAVAILALATLAAFFPAMRYEIRERTLSIQYGPFIHYEIPLAEIRSIRKTDLPLSVMSSFRFPGIALFQIPTSTEGDLKMCSTSAARGILVIKTSSEKYGVTPEKEEDFIASIQAKMPG